MKQMIRILCAGMALCLVLCGLASCAGEQPGGFLDGEIGSNADSNGGLMGAPSSKGEALMPSAPGADDSTADGDYVWGDVAEGDMPGESDISGKGDGMIGDSTGGSFEHQAGQLTGAEWNDNDRFEAFWAKINGQERGWYEIASKWKLVASRRIHVRVSCEGNPVPFANVVLYDGLGKSLYRAVSDASGDAYLFYDLDRSAVQEPPSCVTVTGRDGQSTTYELSGNEGEITVELASTTTISKLDVMFMIDTTGSMGDELEYLKAEMGDVIRRVADECNVKVRTSVNFYRDRGDEYELRYFDFREDVDEVVSFLAKQRAAGGGDYEEAVDTALDYAINQARWDEDAVKLVFLVLDAPPHYNADALRSITNSIRKAAEMGIRIIPVASSGVDTTCQVLFRTWAVLTGGTYTYLTDHSGIGGSHQKPDVEEQNVELLNNMLVRIIKEYVEGTRWDLIAPVDPHKYDCEGIEQAVASEIKIAYCRFTCEKNYGGDLRFEPSDMFVTRYEGKIGECHIVMMGGDEIDYNTAERSEEVAGYTLWFSDGQPVYAYHGGSFYTIGEAFEAGLLSREDVYKISTIFSPG
jgi:hypothetical protein